MGGEREQILAEVADEFVQAGRLFFPPDLPESPEDEMAFWTTALARLDAEGLATDCDRRFLRRQRRRGQIPRNPEQR
jgi:hypothetical protein